MTYRNSRKQQDESYKQTVIRAQKDMHPINLIFSKFIHNQLIEKTSDFFEKTIARPNLILAGSIFSFTLTLIAYVIAKKYGYILSGFETILAFIIGWIVGLIYDYFLALFTGKK